MPHPISALLYRERMAARYNVDERNVVVHSALSWSYITANVKIHVHYDMDGIVIIGREVENTRIPIRPVMLRDDVQTIGDLCHLADKYYSAIPEQFKGPQFVVESSKILEGSYVFEKR